MNGSKIPSEINVYHEYSNTSGTNFLAKRSGNVVTLYIFNMLPSAIYNITLDSEYRPPSGFNVDGLLGWSSGQNRPLLLRLQPSGNVSLLINLDADGRFSGSNITDTDGRVFGNVTYVV